MLIDPYEPLTLAPTEPTALAEGPATTPLTVVVSPLAAESGSVSFVSTLPVGFVPADPLATRPLSRSRCVIHTDGSIISALDGNSDRSETC